MKYYTSTTEYNCGIDLHARQMYSASGPTKQEVGDEVELVPTNSTAYLPGNPAAPEEEVGWHGRVRCGK